MGKLGPFNFNEIYCGDMRDLIKEIPNESVHAIITDPPYGNCNSHLRSQNITEETKIQNDEGEEFYRLMPIFFSTAARILNRKASALVCFAEGGGPNLISNRVLDMLSEQLVFDTTVVWNKSGLGMGWRYRRNHEFVFVAHRVGSELRWFDTTKAVPTVLTVPRPMNQQGESHPTPKPVALMEIFLRLHTQPGDVVLDPFSGGGSTALACKKLGRRFVGFEIEKKWCDLANKRLSETPEQLQLL